MAVKIRMKRMGRSHVAFYRVNAVDSRFPRDGRVIEELGFYDPQNKDQAKQFVVNIERCKYWLDNGAVPSETVSSMLKKQGVEHKGLVLPKPGKPKPKVEEKKAEGAAEAAKA
jgi:small subunit ribosomal protein S16